MQHLSELPLEDAISDPELPREELRRKLQQETHADLLTQMEGEGYSAEQMAQWRALLETARTVRADAAAGAGGR
jgi:hypothetical protein